MKERPLATVAAPAPRVTNAGLTQTCVRRDERPPVRLGGLEGRRQGPGGREVLQAGRPPPGADDGDAGLPPADGQPPPHHGNHTASTLVTNLGASVLLAVVAWRRAACVWISDLRRGKTVKNINKQRLLKLRQALCLFTKPGCSLSSSRDRDSFHERELAFKPSC